MDREARQLQKGNIGKGCLCSRIVAQDGKLASYRGLSPPSQHLLPED